MIEAGTLKPTSVCRPIEKQVYQTSLRRVGAHRVSQGQCRAPGMGPMMGAFPIRTGIIGHTAERL